MLTALIESNTARVAPEKTGHLDQSCRLLTSRNTTRGIIMKQIELTQGKVTLVDDEDYDRLSQLKWYANPPHETDLSFYACHKPANSKYVSMHRLILNAPDGVHVDHIDGDGLNNQRSNLRLCTHQQNSMNRRLSRNNTSGYKGVSWHKKDKKWNVRIRINGKRIQIGQFFCLVKAAKAYDKKAIELFGDFARPNFPKGLKNG